MEGKSKTRQGGTTSLRINETLVRLIEHVPTSDLIRYAGHARVHSARQLALLRKIIRETGFLVPILIDANGVVIAGHARLRAARDLGMTSVPAIRVVHLSEAQIRALRIADNRLVELGSWDDSALAIEFQSLIDIDFDLELTAFEIPEIDAVLGLSTTDAPVAETVEISAGPAVNRVGDLWRLGTHRLLCGDSLDPGSYERLLGDASVDMVFVDPPFNVPIRGHVGGGGKIHHREFVMGSGELTEADFARFLQVALSHHHAWTAEGGLAYVCMDWRSSTLLDIVARPLFGPMINLCVWVKDQPGMGSLYRSQHELVHVYRKGDTRHRNNVHLGRFGRNRSNVWTYPGVTGFGTGRRDELALHPTPKPVAMVADAILDCTAPGDRVLDGFMGAGATLMACEKTGRIAHGIELDPIYVDTIIGRWQQATGERAVCDVTGRSFDDIAARRRAATDNPLRRLPPPRPTISDEGV